MRYILFTFLLLLGSAFAVVVNAQEHYQSMVTIPKLTDSDPTTAGYVTALYILSVSVAAFLALVKIIFGGVQYMLSDIVTQKENAKKDIRGALLGLLIVLGAAFILQTINPQLLEVNFLQNAEGVTVSGEGRPIPPPRDTQIGDPPITVGAPGVTEEEVNHYVSTCEDSGGVINAGKDFSGNITYKCEAAPDEVAETTFECTDNTCVCTNANRSVCVTACTARAPEGAALQRIDNLGGDEYSCVYVTEEDTCPMEFFVSCQTINVGGPNCEVDESRVCATVESGQSTYFYYR